MPDPHAHPHPRRTGVHAAGQAVTAALTVFTLGLFIALFSGAACSPSVQRAPTPEITDKAVIANAVNRLCYAFGRYTIEDLDRAAAEGDINYLAGLQGVPRDLAAVATGYWDDPRVRDVATSDVNRQIAGQRHKAVYDRCVARGWKPGTKASDQPPAK